MFTHYEFCDEDETQVWKVERRCSGVDVDPPTARDFALTDTPSDTQAGWSLINRPLRQAVNLINDQLPKENLWLEERVLRLAEEITRQRALREQHRLS